MNTKKQNRVEQLETSIKQLISQNASVISENSELKKELYYYRNRAESHNSSTEIPVDVRKILAGFVHDLKGRIAYIAPAINFIEEGASAGFLSSHLPKIKASIKQMEYSLETMRHTLKLCEVSKKPVDIIEVVNNAINFTKFNLPSNISIFADILSSYSLIVMANENQLTLIIIELLENAVQAMKKGKENILSVKIKERSHDNIDNVEVSIIDTGCGISNENLNNVFDINFSTKREGWGLGLYLAKETVEDLGGSISIKSTYEKGTAVTITIPIYK